MRLTALFPQLRAANLLLPLEEELEVQRQRTIRTQNRLDGQDGNEHIAFVVGGSARIDPAVAYVRFERRAAPELQWVSRLRIEVAVDQNSWPARRVQPLAVDDGMAAGRQDAHSFNAGRLQAIRDPAGRPLYVVRMIRQGRDAGNTQEIE